MEYNHPVRSQKLPEDLSVEELRRLLVEKRRKSRQEQLERFRKTGRVVSLASDLPAQQLDHLRSAEEVQLAEVTTASKNWGRRILDSLLLLVEVGAVAGLIFLILSGIQTLRELNLEVAEALELPTLTPTPLIMAVVLPSGHTPPTSPGGAAPNEAEIPEHLRPLVQNLIDIPIPTPGPEQAIRIQIPAIHLDAPVVQGDGWEQLKKGVGQRIGTPNPGEKGNLVLSAHNDVFGEFFRDLDQLKSGDSVMLYTNQRAYTYIVTSSEIVEPTRVEVMMPTSQAVVTLISCYPYLIDNQRIVVRASLQSGN